MGRCEKYVERVEGSLGSGLPFIMSVEPWYTEMVVFETVGGKEVTN